MNVAQLSLFDRALLKYSALLDQTDRWISLLTAVVPGQTASIELGVETAISSTALLNIYKKQLLMKLMKPTEKPPISRFIEAEQKIHKSYKTMSYMLSIIKSSELLLEMTASSLKGQKARWNTILGIESLKASIRLAMLAISKKVIPTAAPLHDVDMSPEEIEQLFAPSNALVGTENIYDFDLKRTLKLPSRDELRPPVDLLRTVDTKLTISEVLSIIRPLVYALMFYRYRHRKWSWTPWLTGISIEFVSREMARSSLNSPAYMKTNLENDVYSGRDRDMLWWLVRGAMYEHNVRPLCGTLRNWLSKIPILSMGSVFVDDYLYYLDEYHFSSSTL